MYRTIEIKCKNCNKPCIYGIEFCEKCGDERIKNIRMKKQRRVEALLEENGFKPLSIDRPIKGGTGKERPDFLFKAKKHHVVLETDENQHSHLSEICEEIFEK